MTETGNFCKKIIEDICEKFGPRPSCSKSANEAAEYIKSMLNNYCDDVYTEEITGFPGFFKPFIGYPIITNILYFIAISLYLFIPILSLICCILAIYVSFFKIFSLEEYNFFYYIYPRRHGLNVIGKIAPKHEPKKMVILGCHHDSPYAFPLFNKLRDKAIYFILIIVLIAILFVILTVLRIIFKIFVYDLNMLNILNYLIIIPIIGGIPLLIFGIYFISPYKTLGANDNLSGVSICLAVAKLISENKLNNTEIWIISFDSEESGMRGSKLFVKRHLNELKEKLTACINYDTVGVDELIICPTKETMYRATHSSYVYEKFKQAADNINLGVLIKEQGLGGTDSAPFSRKKLKAASVLRLTESGLPTIWHSRKDIPENIDENKLEDVVKISLEFVKLIDNE
ncbi:MAG: M28 family metallopeptidase [Candidatus Helarchaeota archaeon]